MEEPPPPQSGGRLPSWEDRAAGVLNGVMVVLLSVAAAAAQPWFVWRALRDAVSFDDTAARLTAISAPVVALMILFFAFRGVRLGLRLIRGRPRA